MVGSLICNSELFVKIETMSLRGSKRASNRTEETTVCKRRKTEAEDAQWQARPINDLKIPTTIYNRSAPEAPAELFRKDLISAMKLADSEPLAADEYWIITDPWKQEWERGVQVPVKPDSLPEPAVTELQQRQAFARDEFKLPKMKYIRLTRDANFDTNKHHLSSAVTRAEAACAYDMDACDAAWLRALNGERAKAGAPPLHEEQLERVIEELEIRCWDKIQAIMKSEEGLGIEYDENVICDVCRSPDSEEGNEMVFCDSCNICVHQACYGITTIPSGQWLCSPCRGGVNPVCALCPNLGGAMKSTQSGHKWAHVSCVLWIPEVSIGCAEKMEPITKISSIPASRWSLICVLCRDRNGACIQCSVKSCKTAYHVTCAFKHNLEMRAIIEDENADDGVKLRSYCQKHSMNSKKDKCAGSGSEEEESRRKRRKDMTTEEKSQARAIRLHEIEAEFDRHVSIKDISTHLLDVDQDGIQYMYNYWKLKRKAGHNRPLLPPKTDESDMLMHRQEQADIDKKKMFVQLRQDLERVRNLCYMVSRREKLSRSFFRMREQTFQKQVAVLSGDHTLTPAVTNAVVEANHGPSIYDRLYSHSSATDHKNDFENILAQIAGLDSEDDIKKDLNGLIRRNKPENPYRRLYFNGSARRSTSIGDYSGLSSGAESLPDREVRPHSKYRRPIYSSTDEDEAPLPIPPTKKKAMSKEKDTDNNGKIAEKKKSRSSISRSKICSSSEDEKNTVDAGWQTQRSSFFTLRQIEREMCAQTHSASDSDDMMSVRPMKKYKLSDIIYPDSECSESNKNEDINEDKSSNATSDSQQQPFRTKAAVKEFIPIPKGVNKNTRQIKKYKGNASDEDVKNKENMKTSKNKDYPSDLIVPQRQAAKKASENMRSTTTNSKSKDSSDNNDSKPSPIIDDARMKFKQKIKDKKKDNKEVSKEMISKKELKPSAYSDLFDFEKESEKDNQDILAYVPQRQAAKKAAEHIKSGMSKVPEGSTDDANKKKEPVIETSKKSPKKDDKKAKSNKSTSSSSSSSSSSSCSSSSSEYDEETDKTTPKIILETRRSNNSRSLFSPPRRMSADLPFLDEGTKVISSSSPSSDSEAKGSPIKHHSNKVSPSRTNQKKSNSPITENTKTTSGVSRKTSDKKSKNADGLSESGRSRPIVEGEKSAGTNSASSRTSTRTRARSFVAGSGNISDRKVSGQRKSIKEENVPISKDSKENRESSKLPLTQWKAHKKLKYSNDHSSENNSESKKSTKDFNTSLSSKPSANDTSSNFKSDRLSEKVEEKKAAKDDQVSIEDKKEKVLSKDIQQKHPKTDQTRRDGFDTAKISESQNKDSEKSLRKASGQILRGANIVKSPKTPLQVDHNLTEPCEGQTPRLHEPKDKLKSKLIISDSIEKATGETFPDCDTIQDTDNHKAKSVVPPVYPNRSIFSPPAFKDTGVPELFDFEKELLAVDENVNDEGFNMTQGNDEMMKTAPLTFSFGSEFFFKEEVKEDRGVKETLNLVEKLRMKMESKKSGTANQGENNESEIEVKENDNNMTSFSECSPYKKSEISDETKDFEKCDLIPVDKVIDKNSMSLPQTLPDMPYEIVDKPESSQIDSVESEPDRCDVKKEEKAWTNNNKTISDQNSNNSHHEKIITYNLTNECLDNTLNDSKTLSNDILDKPQSIGMLEKERYLPHPRKDDLFKNNVDNNICNESARIEAPLAKQNKTLPNRANDVQESFQSYENENVIQPPECTPIPSPYNSNKQQTKWSESELMPVRRSSTSSSASDGSSVSHKHDDIENSKPNENIPPQVLNPMLQNMEYSNMPQYHPCSIDPLDYSQFSSEATQFLGEPPLFPPSAINSKLALPNPAAQIYHPNLNLQYQTANAMINQLPKINVEPINFPTPCSVTFTTSSHNIALTTAMIAPLTPKPVSEYSSNHDGEPDLTSPHQFVMHESPLTPIEEFSNSSIVQSQVDKSQTSVPNISPIQDKKSPSKPTRTSSRFVPHQIKSPCKSPGKSPKQIDSIKGGVNRRGIARNSRGSKNRGRPKGKSGQNILNYSHIDMNYYGIHNKLVGTVYDLDFDEDIANNSVSDLKSMRERRRSTDVHDRKSESSYRDSSQSPKFTSPSQHSNKRSFTADIKELRPPTPIQELPATTEPPRSPTTTLNVPVAAVPQFTSIVQPVLPGPVDMRTYSTFEPSNTDAFNNHLLGAFASGTADQQLAEIDEESEKELHYALIASSNKPQESFETSSVPIKHVEKNIEEPVQCYDLSTPKVSLTDPRNQLKVKIKGPFLDANYSGSCVTPAIQQPSLPVMEQPSGMQILGTPSAVGSATSAMLSGTSNLRRMRKKELLRQYCTQDMNMDDPMSGTSNNQVSIPAPVTFNRNVITIPKAVASMTSIPTKEDYKAVVDANMEKKRRKISGGLSRELRHLDCSNDVDNPDNMRTFTPSQLALSYKRRGRAPKPTTNSVSAMPSAPKLKIKFGSCVTSEQTTHTEDPVFDSQFKPPKKRLMSMPRPSVEDLKRESMKYRRKVMADFQVGEKEKKKRIKSEKRKKKKEKWGSEMRVVDKELDNSTKLIIRLSRKKGEDSNANVSGDEGTSTQFSDQPAEYVPNPPLPTEDPYDYDPTAPDPLAIDSPAPTENSLSISGAARVNSSKVSPIRLKLSRDRDGPNYVMKDCPGAVTEESSNINLVGPSNSDPLSCPSIPHNKHCEVR